MEGGRENGLDVTRKKAVSRAAVEVRRASTSAAARHRCPCLPGCLSKSVCSIPSQLTVHLPGLGPVVEDKVQQATVLHVGGDDACLLQ